MSLEVEGLFLGQRLGIKIRRMIREGRFPWSIPRLKLPLPIELARGGLWGDRMGRKKRTQIPALAFSKAELFLSLAVGWLQKLLTLFLSRGEMEAILKDTSALLLFPQDSLERHQVLKERERCIYPKPWP